MQRIDGAAATGQSAGRGARRAPLAYGTRGEMGGGRKRVSKNRSDRPAFSFILKYEVFIDDNNCYVEAFDTLDGAHWEIAVNVNEHFFEVPWGRRSPRISLTQNSTPGLRSYWAAAVSGAFNTDRIY